MHNNDYMLMETKLDTYPNLESQKSFIFEKKDLSLRICNETLTLTEREKDDKITWNYKSQRYNNDVESEGAFDVNINISSENPNKKFILHTTVFNSSAHKYDFTLNITGAELVTTYGWVSKAKITTDAKMMNAIEFNFQYGLTIIDPNLEYLVADKLAIQNGDFSQCPKELEIISLDCGDEYFYDQMKEFEEVEEEHYLQSQSQ